MKAALEAMTKWLLILLIVGGLTWLLDRMVFGINAPGLFA